eukprot:100540-Karenia_brevis.AAC.1
MAESALGTRAALEFYPQSDLRIILQVLDGNRETIAVNPSQRLIDVQRSIAQKFERSVLPERVAMLIKPSGDVIKDLLALPFTYCKEGDVFNVVFEARQNPQEPVPAPRVQINFKMPSGNVWQLLVTTDTRLRDVQPALTKSAGGRFPSDMVSLSVYGNQIYDNFNDLPFEHAIQNDVYTVMLSKTDDPYFFDLSDRRPTAYKNFVRHHRLQM